MAAAVSLVFFLSGFAALLFESLWFRQAHLAFGSSVWASSLVLSSFMAGVALGSAVAARFGTRIRRPVLAYAVLEGGIAVLGLLLVFLLPRLGVLLSPLFAPLLDLDVALQPLRFVSAFVLLLGPAAAMGATLPLLVRSLAPAREDFGGALALLYGWNTLGAVFGALAGEVFLLSSLGVFGAGTVAAGVSLLAASGALMLARRSSPAAEELPRDAAPGPSGAARARALRLLAAAFVSGAALLALEVVWLRLLLLFVLATSRAFAVVLAVVLAGIASGSLAASSWMRRVPRADRNAPAIAFGAGCSAILGYALLDRVLPTGAGQTDIVSPEGLGLAIVLMGPASFASGLLFTLLGQSLNESVDLPVRSAGLLVLVNTVGAAIGPLLAGFVMLPALGVERSIFVACLAYGGVGVLAARGRIAKMPRAVPVLGVAFLASALLFPFGRMQGVLLPRATEPLLWPGAEVVAFREGLTETIQVGQVDFLGEPVAHQLLTNGYPMAASGPIGRRYMSLYVHLPVALHPRIERALLISYGVGNTARSLTRVEGIRSIDVVDISREIFEMGEVIFASPGENPVLDPRVRLHVEDGRYFLQTSSESFDLITGEPPPPRVGNVSYLYTQEYFQLAWDRLRPGGLISYWLPVDQLAPEEAGSILGAFCAVFPDCTLWNGGSLNWTLLGSRGGVAPLSEEMLRRQWQEARAREDLRAIGVEDAEALGALFLADEAQLGWLRELAPPLRDAFPLRIQNRAPAMPLAAFARFQESGRARARFLQSPWVRAVWPESMRGRTARTFRETGLFDGLVGVLAVREPSERAELLREALEETELQTLAILALGAYPDASAIASRRLQKGEPAGTEAALALARGALARRDWTRAAEHFARAPEPEALSPLDRHLAAYAACRAGSGRELDAWRRRLFEARASAIRIRVQSRGVDGCWAAAWDPGWRRS